TETAVERFVKTFYPKGCTHQTLAILSEGATTFGNVGRAKDLTSEPSDFRNCIANYVYPREIASLRNAARAATGNTTATGSSTAASTPSQLPLDLTDRTNSNDAPPDYSIVQSPLSKEAVLMNLAAGMRRARYHYIGISGSNILDVLFLANFLREACPDSRLFV